MTVQNFGHLCLGALSNSACCSYSSLIVHALSKLPDLEKAQLRVTFDLVNFIARVVSDQMLRMANHILDWLDILSYQFSRLIFNSACLYPLPHCQYYFDTLLCVSSPNTQFINSSTSLFFSYCVLVTEG